jgi:hypothetical protein
MKKRGTYPCGTARVPGITFRGDRNKPWRVRLYKGPTTVVFDSNFPTFAEAKDILDAVRSGALETDCATEERVLGLMLADNDA